MMIAGAQCDKCGEVIWFADYVTKCRMQEMLRKAGWSVGSRRDGPMVKTLCPNCKRRKKNG